MPPTSDQQIAIITGAGSGIGQALALALAHRGYQPTLVGRTEEKLQQTSDQISSLNLGVTPLIVASDITDPQACQNIIDQTLTVRGRIDVLANVAGFASVQPIDQVTADLWRTTVDANLSAVVYLTTAVWPIFSRQNSGFIANISSMASVDPFPGFSIYAAAKVAVNMFTRCTATEGDAIGINAVCVAPGAVETPMLRGLFDEQTIPKQATLDPKQVAAVIIDCLSGKRPFDPGETILLPSP